MILDCYGELTPFKKKLIYKNYYNCHTGMQKGIKQMAVSEDINIFDPLVNDGEEIIRAYEAVPDRDHPNKGFVSSLVKTPCEHIGDLQTIIIRINNFIIENNIGLPNVETSDGYITLLSTILKIVLFKIKGISAIDFLNSELDKDHSDCECDTFTGIYGKARLETLYQEILNEENRFLEVQYNGRLKNIAILLHLFMSLINMDPIRDSIFFVKELNICSWDNDAGDIVTDHLKYFKNQKYDILELLNQLISSEDSSAINHDFINNNIEYIRNGRVDAEDPPLFRESKLFPNYDQNIISTEVFENSLLFGKNIVPYDMTLNRFTGGIRDLTIDEIHKYDRECEKIDTISENAIGMITNYYDIDTCVFISKETEEMRKIIRYNDDIYLLYKETDDCIKGISLFPVNHRNRKIVTFNTDPNFTFQLEAGKVGELSYGN